MILPNSNVSKFDLGVFGSTERFGKNVDLKYFFTVVGDQIVYPIVNEVPSKEQRYPTWGKVKSSTQKCLGRGIC